METPEPISLLTEGFLDLALLRIRKFLIALALAGIVVTLIFFRWPTTAGFVVGALISYVNQIWLERAIDALGERITSQGSNERGGIIVFRAILRYVFIALGAYVIFNVSLAALYGFLGGVCLPIAAIACEVAIEIFAGLRHET